MLLGNVLRWETGYLGRQYPVLPASPGFARKVKPLVRLGEREMAAYCVLQGIDYQVEECPMAEGNKHLGYKDVLNSLEDRSPGSKAAFLFGFFARGHDRFAEENELAFVLAPCPECGSPTTTGGNCAFCSLAAHAPPGAEHTVPRPLAVGDRVLLIDSKQRRHLITLAEGAAFHSHAGVVDHGHLIGQEEGITVRTSKNARIVAVRPTLAEYVLKMPRGAQVIYPKDLGPILMLADIFPGAKVLESGVGSGALTMTLLRAIGPAGHVHGYELRDDFADRARRNVEGFLGPDVPLSIEVRDVVRRHRRDGPRPDPARPPRAVAGGEARGRCARRGWHPALVPADDRTGDAVARGAERVPVRHGRDARGAPARLERRRPVGPARPPHGRPHRVPDPRPPAGADAVTRPGA